MSLPLIVALVVTTATPAVAFDEVWSKTSTITPPIGPGATPPIESAPQIESVPQIQSAPELETDGAPVEAEGFEPGAPRLEPRPPPAPPPPAKARKLPPEEHVWYGWMTLLVGGTGLATTLVGIALESALVTYAGTAVFGLGPGAVHWGHGNLDMGFASIGIQIGLPVASTLGIGMIGAIAASSNGDLGVGIVYAGALLGALVSLGVDAAVLAWITEQPLLIRPAVAVDATSATFGLGGQF